MKKICVGTENKRKIESVKKALSSCGIVARVVGCAAASGVPDTPYDSETARGARNRAMDARKNNPSCDLWIGVESGLVHREGDLYEEVWACLMDVDGEYVAYSSGVRVPIEIDEAMDDGVASHPVVMADWRAKKCRVIDPERGVDTWGDYTDGHVMRDEGLYESVRNVCAQYVCAQE